MSLVNKLLHGPLTALKGQGDAALISATRKLFSLDDAGTADAERHEVREGALAKERG
ncbi:MAG: hypothetical protein ACI9KE_003364 [Polyangiales bacterium]|jgi:hypothetical protein